MKFVTNLIYKGQCREAFEAYSRIFHGTITTIIPFAEAPDSFPKQVREAEGILHAWLDVGDQSLTGRDALPGHEQPMSGFSATFQTSDVEEARRVFDALSEGGTITMPFGTTFFSTGYGMLTDRYDTPWIVNTDPGMLR